jgi:antitoxin (DNA-binding transcriptional repressor) of toxin-antitoxin stability system
VECKVLKKGLLHFSKSVTDRGEGVSHRAQREDTEHTEIFECIVVNRQFMNATIVDLRYRMKDVLRAIDRGETVTVLYRGRVKAALMPVSAAVDVSGKDARKTVDQPLFGLWADRDDLADPASYVRQLRQPRVVPDGTGVRGKRSARKAK